MNSHHDKVHNVDPEHKAFEIRNLETVEEHNRGEQAVTASVDDDVVSVLGVARVDVHLAVARMDRAAAPMAAPESRALVRFAANLALLSTPIDHRVSAEDASATVGMLTLLLFRHNENPSA